MNGGTDVITQHAVRTAAQQVLAAVATAGKPLRTTMYTTGAGTHEIIPESTYQIITLQGAGANGAVGGNTNSSVSSGGGGGAAGLHMTARTLLSGDVPYQVGAPGKTGGSSVFGTLRAPGGAGALAGGTGSATPGGAGGVNTASQINKFAAAQATPGGGGGAGGDAPNTADGHNGNPGVAGCAAGFTETNGAFGTGTALGGAGGVSGYSGGGGGGDSVMGRGGNGGTGKAPGLNGSGYGSGGGGSGINTQPGGSGQGGCIIVEEY